MRYRNGTTTTRKLPINNNLFLLSCVSTYLENGSWIKLLLIRNNVLANPAAKMVHPKISSLMKIARMGVIRPNHVNMVMSDNIRYFILRFMVWP